MKVREGSCVKSQHLLALFCAHNGVKNKKIVVPVGLPTSSHLFIFKSLVEKVPGALHCQLQSKELTLLNFKTCMPILFERKTTSTKHFLDFASVLKHHQLLLDLCMNLFIESVLRLFYTKE